MENKEAPISFYVLASFGLLFLVFFFLGQPGTTEQQITGNNVTPTGALAISDLTSTIGLAVMGAVIILIVGLFFVLFKKMANKKKKAEESGIVEASNENKKVELPGSNLEEKHEEGSELLDSEVDQLFGGDEEPEINAPEFHKQETEDLKQGRYQVGKKESLREEDEITPSQKTMTNASELKSKIKVGLKKEVDKGRIFEILRRDGYTIQQIDRATEEINLENLRNYIIKCKSMGLSKLQVLENLKKKNWDLELVKKAFLSFNQ